jgi:hypothetical protein
MIKKYNHAFDFAFEVVSLKEDGSDVTPEMLRAACVERAERVGKTEEMLEACSLLDTYEIEKEFC